MIRLGRLSHQWLFALAMLLSGFVTPAFSGPVAEPASPLSPLNTIADIRQALRGCWQWPPANEASPGMELSVLLSFKRDGEILGAHITYQAENISDEERALYHDALVDTLKLCSPLPFSTSLGEAIAGRPMTLHIHDTRQQRLIKPTELYDSP